MSPPSPPHSITFSFTSQSPELGFLFPYKQSPDLQLISPIPGTVFIDFRGQSPIFFSNLSFYGPH